MRLNQQSQLRRTSRAGRTNAPCFARYGRGGGGDGTAGGCAGFGGVISEISAALSSIKVAGDIAKGISALKSESEINQAIIDIQRALLDAQTSALEDKQKIDELLAKIQDLQTSLKQKENWADVQKRYVLTKSEVGTFTYDLRTEFTNDEIFHRLCVACFENGKKSILQGNRLVECQTCGNRMRIKDPQPVRNEAY
jgi:DNA-directed RNA polymerase subunit RPC12/RpoP